MTKMGQTESSREIISVERNGEPVELLEVVFNIPPKKSPVGFRVGKSNRISGRMSMRRKDN
ncbi:MAG: hypothetical protein A2288_02450 [Candidatus Moranbacteria bacterium RIFOXYA12_FULL_44_15]|nr:MAG: hypothetical protein A2288_02450 [Candidatus Moranbacteria bacterium RIFOXYA12_FULL_44_15]